MKWKNVQLSDHEVRINTGNEENGISGVDEFRAEAIE